MHLTYQDSDGHTSPASSAIAEEDGAPGEEIEVTPEMVEAAAIHLVESGQLSEYVTSLDDGVRLLAKGLLRAGLSQAHPSKTAG